MALDLEVDQGLEAVLRCLGSTLSQPTVGAGKRRETFSNVVQPESGKRYRRRLTDGDPTKNWSRSGNLLEPIP
jgi:hypothetical protein